MRKLTKLIFVTDTHTDRQTDESDLIGPFSFGGPKIKKIIMKKITTQHSS